MVGGIPRECLRPIGPVLHAAGILRPASAGCHPQGTFGSISLAHIIRMASCCGRLVSTQADDTSYTAFCLRGACDTLQTLCLQRVTAAEAAYYKPNYRVRLVVRSSPVHRALFFTLRRLNFDFAGILRVTEEHFSRQLDVEIPVPQDDNFPSSVSLPGKSLSMSDLPFFNS